MRLTLRTLLAYIDEILEPKDAQEIGKKVEESEFARDLLQRIRDVMQRLRLKAPELDEQDTALDPNTVAEYLDNVLPADRVPDFEKICLESDMHLAEVASCHQILAMVLGEPAEIDPASREHMYMLPQVDAEQSEMETVAAGDDEIENSATASVRPQRPRPEIPEYLRERPKWKRRMLTATALATAGCLVAVLLASAGLLESLGIRSPFAERQLVDSQSVAGEAAADADLPQQATQDAELSAADQTATGEAAVGVDDTQPAPTPFADQTDGELSQPGIVAGIQQPSVTQPVQSPAGFDPESTADALPADQTNHQPVARSSDFPPAAVPSAINQIATPEIIPSQAVPSPNLSQAGQPLAIESGVEQAIDTDAKPADSPPSAPVPPELVGRFISDNDVLLCLAPGEAEWGRVSAQDIITPQQELLSLPTFRPLIAMTAGLTLRLIDGTRIVFQPSDAEGVVGLKIDYGRLIVQTVGRPQTPLAIKLGKDDDQISGVLTFGDAATTLTIEVAHDLVLGSNPENRASRLKAVFCVVTGHVQWAGKDAQPLEIAASQKLVLGKDSPAVPTAIESSPDWIVADSLSIIDQRAAATVGDELNGQRPISLTLKELAEHRKKEIRRLAIRCLGHLGNFDPMAAALNDPSQWLMRSDYIADLRASLARGPQVATEVREAFQRQYGPDALALYRLLWGFTNEQLGARDAQLGSGNVDEVLVDCLNNNLLAVRALAFWNLQSITGLGLYYKPEDTPIKRQQPIRNWRQRLKEGEIRHRKTTSSAG